MISIPGTTITIDSLSRQTAAQLGVSIKDCAAVCNSFVDHLIDEILNGNRIVISGLGVFQLATQMLWEYKNGTMCRNPSVQILKPKFTYCVDLRTRKFNAVDGSPYVKPQPS